MGTVDMGFIHLCGVPSIGYKHEEYLANKEVLWNKLVVAQRNKHIVTVGTLDKTKSVE